MIMCNNYLIMCLTIGVFTHWWFIKSSVTEFLRHSVFISNAELFGFHFCRASYFRLRFTIPDLRFAAPKASSTAPAS